MRGIGRVGELGYEAGDAMTAERVDEIVIEGSAPGEMLIFNLP